MTTTTSTAVVVYDPGPVDPEHVALAGFLGGYRGLTRDAYALDLRQFVAFCDRRHLGLFEVRRSDIESFGRELEAGRAERAFHLCEPENRLIRVGIRWRAGAHEEQSATRTRMLTHQDAIELIRRRKNEGLRDTDIAAELRVLGLHTARGREFGTRDVRNVRHSIGLSRPSPLEPDELTVREVAARLGVKPGTVYYWLRTGEIPHRKPATGAVCIPFTADIEAALRARPAVARFIARTQPTATGGAV
jgi:excisionase family DNA binding protein